MVNTFKANSSGACPGKRVAGSSGSNQATKLEKVTSSFKSQLAKNSLVQIEDVSSKNSECQRKRNLLEVDSMWQTGISEKSHWGTEGSPSNSIPIVPSTSASFSVPQSKSKPRYRQEKKPMEENNRSNLRKIAGTSIENTDISKNVIIISDSDSEEKLDGVATDSSNWKGREGSSLGSGKLAPLCGSKKIKVPWKEVISKNSHTEIIVGKINNNNLAAGPSSSRMKKHSTTRRGMEHKLRGRMPPIHQRNSMVQIQKSPMKGKGSDGRILHLESDNYGKAGRGDFTRKYNFGAGESSVSHKSATGLSMEEIMRNVNDIFARCIAKQLEQRVDMCSAEEDSDELVEKTAFPKENGKGMMPWALREFSSTCAWQSPSSSVNLGPNKTNRQYWPDTLKNIFNNGPTGVPLSQSQPRKSHFTPTEYRFFPKGKGPLDSSYSNEAAIPTMPLLSLIDSGMQSNESFSEGLVEKELFPKCQESVPSEGGNTSLFQTAENDRRATPVPTKLFGIVLEQGISAGPYAPAEDRGCRLEKSADSPSKDKQNEILGGVDSLFFPSQRQNVGSCLMQGNVGSMNDQPQLMCVINRIPADFCYPDEVDEYMRGRNS